ncbi:MAG: hypothetical protein A2W26_03735 [Acidobacteria bacterium RBG_16_64_8]|nr:MAG: hypothetical protein A2W26_03735 [Acidobacteria bacterium RBG_16_64_8]
MAHKSGYGVRPTIRKPAASDTTRKQPTVTVGYRPSLTQSRIVGSGIIEAGAHPEMERGVKIGNPIEQIGGAWNKLFPKSKKPRAR